jgi:hypothetical protein
LARATTQRSPHKRKLKRSNSEPTSTRPGFTPGKCKHETNCASHHVAMDSAEFAVRSPCHCIPGAQPTLSLW